VTVLWLVQPPLAQETLPLAVVVPPPTPVWVTDREQLPLPSHDDWPVVELV
jgi:hypothetical protein